MPSGRSPVVIAAELRSRLEPARLDLLVLFRALDRMDLTAREIQQKLLRQASEPDFDYAEALWALDHLPAHLSCGLHTLARFGAVAAASGKVLAKCFHRELNLHYQQRSVR